MNKIILPSSFDFDQPIASLIGAHRQGLDRDALVKRASSAPIVEKFAEYSPKPGHSLIHLIAMGSTDTFGANRNGDIFYKNARAFDIPESDWKQVHLQNGRTHQKSAETFTNRTETGLIDQYPTFVTHGDVYWHHRNKKRKGDTVYGAIKAAEYNHPMERVELLVEVDDARWASDLEKLANGDDLSFSMSCTVPFDICTACGHKAKNRGEYCDHLAKHLGQLDKSGHVIGAVNERPVFFDISKVHRPADRIAHALTKAAEEDRTLGGAELAEQIDHLDSPPEVVAAAHPGRVSDRIALIHKLARMEKEIPTCGRVIHIRRILNSDVPEEEDPETEGDQEKSSVLFDVLAKQGACLPFRNFASILLPEDILEKAGELIDEAESNLPWVYRSIGDRAENVASNLAYDPRPGNEPYIEKAADSLAHKYGLTDRALKVRSLYVPAGIKVQEKSAEYHQISPPAQQLLNEYAAYQLSFLENAKNVPSAQERCIALNTK